MSPKIISGKFIRAVLCILCVLAAQTVYALPRKVTISVAGQPVSEVLKTIEKQSGYNIFYNNASIDKEMVVSISAKDENPLVVINRIFAGTGVEASVIDGSIVLSKKDGPQKTDSKNSLVKVSLVSAPFLTNVTSPVAALTFVEGELET